MAGVDSSRSLSEDEDMHVKKIPTAESQYEIDPDIDRGVTRKFDLHILPFLFGIWLFAFIDRSNIGNAKIDGLVTDLKLDGNKFNIALTIFYVPYICVNVPSNWLVKRFKAGFYLPLLILSWGIVSTCIGSVKSYAGLLVARFFLGSCEGGLLGGMVIYLAMFYRRHDLMYRIGLFYCAAPLSGAFGGLLATGLSKIELGGYNGWPWIFFIEGIMTIMWGLVSVLCLPHTPNTSKFLTEEERLTALYRMKLDAHGATTEDDVDLERFSWHWVRMAILNPNTWFTSIAWLLNLIPLYSYSLFLPTIIKSLGHWTPTQAQLLTVPPNLSAFLLVLITAAVSDKVRVRGPFMLAGCALAIIGYIMLLAGSKSGVKYAGTFFVACGVFPNSVMVMGWLANNLAPHYVRATGTGAQIGREDLGHYPNVQFDYLTSTLGIANCAAFVATFTYLSKNAPKYTLGHSINLGALVLCMITVTGGILYCKWENRKRDRGDRDDRLELNHAMLGHRHPNFRYTI